MENWGVVLAFVAFVLALVNMSNTSPLAERVRRLEGELQYLNDLIRGVATAPGPYVGEPAGVDVRQHASASHPEVGIATSHYAEAPAVPRSTRLPRPEPLYAGVGASGGRPDDLPVVPRGPAATPSGPSPFLERLRGTEEWEAVIGGRWMNRIGALALVLGIGFFLKYAIDQNWISQAFRIAIGVAIGVSLLALAAYSHRREYVIFSQGLVGAGTATLYLSIYASFNFYHLVPESVALSAMTVVTALALAQALYYDSLAVAILGWGGGFLTLPLLGIGAGHEIGLIGYVALLVAGLVTIVHMRDDWYVLEPLTLAATYITFLVWALSSYSSSKLGMAAIALTLFWALFYGLDASRLVTHRNTHARLRGVLGAANAACFGGGMLLLLQEHRLWMGLETLALGVVYIATVLLVHRGLRRNDAADARHTVTALVLGTIAVLFLCAGLLVAPVWAIAATILLAAGARWNLRYVWRPALLLYGVSAVDLLATDRAVFYTPIRDFVPLLNPRAAAFLVVAASLAVGARSLTPLVDAIRGKIESGLDYAWCIALFLLITFETSDAFLRAEIGTSSLLLSHLEYERWLALSILWMIYGLGLLLYALRSRVFAVAASGVGAVGIAAVVGASLAVAYWPIESFTLVLNDRAGTVLLLMLGLSGCAYLLLRLHEMFSWTRQVAGAAYAAAGLLGLEVITAEIHDYFRHQTGGITAGTSDSGHFFELMTLAAVWMVCSLALSRYRAPNGRSAVRVGALVLAAMALGSAAVAAIAYEPDTWLSQALTVRTLVLIFLAAGLFIHTLWLREWTGAGAWSTRVIVALQACIVLLGFELVSAQARDIFHYHVARSVALGHSSDADRLRNLEQLTLSVTWLAYAIVLMVVGLWRRTRWLRLGAIGLLGFIILKIFVYDLGFLSPAYRSISFAGLGLILLAVSFLYGRYRGLLLES